MTATFSSFNSIASSMALSSWLCTNNTKNMLVKIVLPGGRVELYDRPVLAAEIMLKYPRCCVTHPHVFRQPWAVLPPDTVLMLGHKFYVVPISTLRKLQRNHLRRSSSTPRHDPSAQNFVYQPIGPPDGEDDAGADPACWFFSAKNTATSSSWCFKHQSHDDADGALGKESGEDSCFMWLMPGSKSRGGEGGPPSTLSVEDSNKVGESPRRSSISTAWQPSLARISEDKIL